MLDMMLTWDQTGSYEVTELRGVNEEGPSSDDWMTTLLQTKAFHKIPPANIQAIFMRMQRVDYQAPATSSSSKAMKATTSTSSSRASASSRARRR